MQITFTDEQLMIRDMVRKFVDQDVRPLAHDIDMNQAVPRHIIDKAAELGLLGIVYPTEYDGIGEGEVTYCMVLEELARGCSSTTITISAHQSIGAMPIHLAGNDAQKKKYLAPCARGEKIAAFALTEPNYGSDASNLQTYARREGDYYYLNGSKIWITNGGIADTITVFARTNRDIPGARGVSAFIVEKDFPGFKVGKLDHKMGLRGSSTAELIFEDCKVPAENLLKKEGRGLLIAVETLLYGRITLGAMCLGMAREALAQSVKFAKERIQFGEPIAKKQAIQLKLAEMAADVFAMEGIVYRAAAKADRKEDFSREACISKWFCSEHLAFVVDQAVQIHGGMGYVSDAPIERLYRDARITRIFEGTSEIQLLTIAEDILRKGL